MTTVVSTGYAAHVALGSTSFVDAFRDGVIDIYSGPQPGTADAPPSGTLLGQITADGLPWTPGSEQGGLRWGADGRYVIKTPGVPWVLTGVAAGTAGWFRLRTNAPDDGELSMDAVRLDGAISPVGGEGAELWLATTSITPDTAILIQNFWIAVPPLPGGS